MSPRLYRSSLKKPMNIQSKAIENAQIDDIFQSIKKGDHEELHSLLQAMNITNPSYITGLQEDYKLPDDQIESMEKWNVLLIAIAFNQVNIVKYLMRNCMVNLKSAGRNPSSKIDGPY